MEGGEGRVRENKEGKGVKGRSLVNLIAKNTDYINEDAKQ